MTPAQDNFSDINKLIHEPARLSIMAVLSACEQADFKYLENSTNLTAGNLSSHLSKLEKANYIDIQKSFKGKVPVTMVRITKNGMKEFNKYLKQMRAMMKNLPK